MTDLRCWQCGVEPLGVTEVTRIENAEPEYVPTRWPDADHQHAATPPTPEQLTADGHTTWRRIMEAQ